MKGWIIGAIIAAIIGYAIYDSNETSIIVKAEKEQMMKNPDVVDLGMVDGCSVKYYTKPTPAPNHQYGYKDHTFYIAKCDGKPTTTTTQKVGGKFKHDEAMIAVDKK